MKSSPLAPFLVIVLTVCGLFVMQAKDKRIRDDDPLMERYRHAELEVKQAVSEGRISREEAGRKLREIKGNLWGGEGEKDRSLDKEDSGHGRVHEDIDRIQEAIEKGEISHEEARKKLTEFHEGRKKANREREWKMIKGRIEGAVREGKMSREQANEEYERIERRMHSRDKIFRQANERVRNAEREIHQGLEAGEISHEEAREAVRELHEEMNYLVRRKHLALELEDHERRIRRAVEAGEIGKSEAREKMTEARSNLERQLRIGSGRDQISEQAHWIRRFQDAEREIKKAVETGRLSGEEAERELIALRKRFQAEESEREEIDRHRGLRRHTREGEGYEDRRHHEKERELWETVRRGLDAAVRLGKIDREEAREIWEDFRNEEEGEDEEAFEEEKFE